MKTFNGLSETHKNIKINIKMLILTFLYISENLLYVFKLKLTFYFLQCNVNTIDYEDKYIFNFIL